MKLDRLFHVLVVMAAPTMAACDSADEDGDERRDGQTDAGAGSAAADAPAASTSDGGPAEPCFCNTQTCCDRSTSDPYVLEGFECCWGTTCP